MLFFTPSCQICIQIHLSCADHPPTSLGTQFSIHMDVVHRLDFLLLELSFTIICIQLFAFCAMGDYLPLFLKLCNPYVLCFKLTTTHNESSEFILFDSRRHPNFKQINDTFMDNDSLHLSCTHTLIQGKGQT